jgi:hypothetical protein
MVNDPAIAQCLALQQHADQAALDLVQMALDHGGKDNVTVVVADYSIPNPLASGPHQSETAEHMGQPMLDSTSEFPPLTDEFPTSDYGR